MDVNKALKEFFRNYKIYLHYKRLEAAIVRDDVLTLNKLLQKANDVRVLNLMLKNDSIATLAYFLHRYECYKLTSADLTLAIKSNSVRVVERYLKDVKIEDIDNLKSEVMLSGNKVMWDLIKGVE